MGKHFDRAQILIAQGRYDLAEIELRKEIAENPDLDRGYGTLALCFINQRKLTAETLELINYALSLDAENDWNHYLLAIYWYYRNDFDRAIAAIQVAIELKANSAVYFYVLACILFDLGNSKYNETPPQARILTEFFKIHLMRSYLKPVFEPLQKSLTLDPNSIFSLNLLTNLFIETGRYQPAIQSSQTALSIDPNNAKAQDLHGCILIECGRYAEAIGYFGEALRINPNYTQAKNNLLEAIRSKHYWIYPWISLTNLRGRRVFVSLIPLMLISLLLIKYIITGSVNINTPLENIVFVPVFFQMVIGFPAPCIFNYFLIKDKKARFLLTDRDAIVASYALSLGITVLLWMYTWLLPLDSPFRSLAMNLVGITGGILVPPFTFSAVKEIQSPILPIIYQVLVGIVGLINLILCFQSRITIVLVELFMVLVVVTPAVAIYNCREIE